MERTISRIKNLKARRKLSLPASPGPILHRDSIIEFKEDDMGRVRSQEDMGRVRSLCPGDNAYATLERLQRPKDSSGEDWPDVKGAETKTLRSVSDRRRVNWGPDVNRSSHRTSSEKLLRDNPRGTTEYQYFKDYQRSNSEKGLRMAESSLMRQRQRRSDSVSVITCDDHGETALEKSERKDSFSDLRNYSTMVMDHYRVLRDYPYPRHGSLPHAFKNGSYRPILDGGINKGDSVESRLSDDWVKDEPPSTPPWRRISDAEKSLTTSSPSRLRNDKNQHLHDFPGLASQSASSAALSLPSRINCLSDTEENNNLEIVDRSSKPRRGVKLKRRKAYYSRQKKDGRSKSLTQLDAVGVSSQGDDMDSHSEPEADRLTVPGNHAQLRRRKLSSAGKVSGTEFFTAVFEWPGDEGGLEELVPAIRGVCLREAIDAVCERRGIDVDTVTVVLDNSNTPLPLLTSETSWLGGRTIKIKAKDENRSPGRGSGRGSVTAPTSRKTSAVSNSYRGKQKFFNSSLSTEETGPDCPVSQDGSLKVTKGSKQANRWSGLWGSSAKEQKMEGLVTCLDTYSRLGIPKLHHLSSFPDEDQVEEALYSLEEDWTDIVDGASSLPERLRSQQTALWELITTELAYIRTLKVIQDLFLNCLCNLQNSLILCEIDTESLFCNVPEIYAANRRFWHLHILPMLQESRQSKLPLDPSIMKDGFTKLSELFGPYYKYCAEQTRCQQYCKDQDRDNQLFKAYLAWCETQRDCNRLRLIDILVRPMQRLTKYSLLLKATLKKTDNVTQRRDLVEMDQAVESLVRDVNAHMRQSQEQERLKTIIARIESYEPIETKDEELAGLLAYSCRLDLTCPMPGCAAIYRRYLLLEGDLKLKEGSSKADVHCFLFTDMLLVCKYMNKKGDRVKIIKQPYIVDRLVVAEVTKDTSSGLACVYLNEYKTAAAAFTLHAQENTLVKSWKDNIQKAKELYQEAKASSASSFDQILFNYDEEEDFPSNAYLQARVSRRGSSRASRYSSNGHSHSGSIDLNDASTASAKRDVSLELSDARGSSLSSEDSSAPCGVAKPRASSLDNRLLPQENTTGSYPSSPRTERRLTPHKLSPNTLSIGIEIPPASNSSPTVRSPLSPHLRGISYPPTSPKSLKRGLAIHQGGGSLSRNPPLVKARQVAGTISASIEPGAALEGCNPPITVISDTNEETDGDDIADSDVKLKRCARTDRPDTRRYHTAGTIEDLKKQDSRDASIHKRLSWNQQPCIPGNDLQLKTKQSKCLSSDSVQSSSGVSSNGSLHLSIGSEFEVGAPVPPNLDSSPRSPDVVTVGGLSVPASPRLLARSPSGEAPPVPPRGHHHISTTYITQEPVKAAAAKVDPKINAPEVDTVKGKRLDKSGRSGSGGNLREQAAAGHCLLQRGGSGGNLLDRKQVDKDRQKTLDRVGSGNSLVDAPKPEITINVPCTESKEPVSSVSISISNQKSTKTEILKLRDLLLTDSSVETSNV